MINTKERCVARICRGAFTDQCVHHGTVSENGKLWCKHHAPSLVKARGKARYEHRAAESKARNAEQNRADRLHELGEQIAEEALEIFCTGDLCFTEKLKAMLQDYLDTRTPAKDNQ